MLNPAHAAAKARHEKYDEARRGGLGMWEAAVVAGLDDGATVRRYERWFQAVENGQEIIPPAKRYSGRQE